MTVSREVSKELKADIYVLERKVLPGLVLDFLVTVNGEIWQDAADSSWVDLIWTTPSDAC